MEKEAVLKSLYDEYRRVFDGNEIVLGDGNAESRFMLIGEAPGRDEVRLGKPFVGAAGKNLGEFLDLLGLTRDKIYITNAIKYRLSEVNPKTGKIVNRPAAKDEIKNNRQYLIKEIQIIKPQYIVTLGNVPLKAVTDDLGASIGKVHGAINKIFIQEKEYELYPLYHPASIIYNASLKEVYVNDILRLKEIISH